MDNVQSNVIDEAVGIEDCDNEKPAKPWRRFFPLVLLIASNIVLIFIVLIMDVSITQLIWLYWCEGVLVGLFQFFKILSIEYPSVESLFIEEPEPEKETATSFAFMFLFFQIPLQGFFALWIHFIDPTFDYVHELLVLGGIILGQKIILSLFDKRRREGKGRNRQIARQSCLFFVRFIPIVALYHYLEATQAAEGNMVVLTIEFMLFKLVSDVIFYWFERKCN